MGASSSRPTPMNYPGQRNQMQRNPNTNQQPNATASRVGNGNANANGTATSTISRPGAYGITRNTSSSNMQVYRVVVPPNVRPNQEFQVYAGSRIVRVRCPTGARPGTSVQITVPEEDRVVRASDDMAVLTSADGDGGGGAVRMNSETRRMNANSETESSSALRAYNVVIPPNVHWPGATFPVSVDGRRITVECPPNARPGMTVRIQVPVPSIPSGPPAGMQSATDINRPPELRNSVANTPRRTIN